MFKTPVTAFRLPPELLARVDAYAAALSQQAGVPVSRAAAVVKLLTEALGRAPPPLLDDAMKKRNADAHAARVADPFRGRRRKR